TRTEMKPAGVEVAEMYDGFSFITMAWLEAMGFCGKGESGPYVEGGQRIARDGELALNTHGGQLSAGRLHGYGFLHEACVQLWGEAGERQGAGGPQNRRGAPRGRAPPRGPPPPNTPGPRGAPPPPRPRRRGQRRAAGA